MSQDELEPITPERAKRMYLNARKGEVSESTLDGYHYRLKHFIRWCDERGIENMNDLSGRKLQEFRTWRRDDGDLKPVTLEGNLDALRVFIR
jgi:site-specific recombinase XerD